MQVSFAHPHLAWGALAALLPIAIHLLQRRRPRPHPFAAIELVRRSQRRNVRKLRLRRILLLCARTLLLLAIPLALARPSFQDPAGAVAQSRGPAATAIVLDASMSMRWQDGKRSLFQIAQEDAREVLAQLSTEEPVTWVVCDGKPPTAPAPGFDRTQVRRAIDEAEPSHLSADLGACMAAAAQALGESPLPGKRIVAISDLAASAFRLDAQALRVPTEEGEVAPEIRFIDVARGNPLPNVAVADLQITPAPEVGARAYAFQITLRNYGEADVSDHPVELRVGDEVVSKGFAEIPAGGSVTTRLIHRFPHGGHYRGVVRAAPDALREDDERAFALQVPRDLRVLVVNGSPSPLRYRDEAFFVETALRARGGTPLALTTLDADRFATQDPGAYDLVFLLNVRAPEAPLVAKLREFVQGGGGLFISLGDQVDGDAYNEAFGDLLPRGLHLPKTAADPDRSDQLPARFGRLSFDHPVLQVFAGSGQEGFHGARTYRYFLLQPGEEGQVLAAYDDGAPALVEGEYGAGRVLLYTSTVDRDWSDWPIQTSFLPAMRQIAAYLAQSLEERPIAVVPVGERHALEPLEGAELGRVLGPDRKELPLLSGEAGRFAVEARVPGLYRVEGSRDGSTSIEELPERAFVAVPPAAESDTRRLGTDELQALFGGSGAATVEREAPSRTQRDTPLWSLLLVLGVAAFASEGFLIRK